MKVVNVDDVLKILHKYGKYIFVTDEKRYSSMVDEIANLKALEQQPCEDDVSKFISRQVSLLEERMSSATSEGRWVEEEKCQSAIENLELVDEYIKAHPPVTPKEKTGHWIIKDGKEQGYDIAGVKTWYIQIMCDKCGFINSAIEGHTGQYHFCPNCGAKMVEP